MNTPLPRTYFVIGVFTFEGIGSYGASNDHIGLELAESTGFTVQDNAFSGNASATADRYGILALNTSSEANAIERNSFEELTVANQAEGWNVGLDPAEGLQYRCNDNITNNGHDFLTFDQGVARYQGTENIPSGNSFSRFNTVDGDFRNESTSSITYYYYNGATAEEPLNYFGSFMPEDLNPSNSCQPDEPDGPIIHIDRDIIREIYTKGKEDFHGLKSTYDSLLNGGINKSVWVNQAASLTTATAPTYQQSLLNASPFVTHEVLEATMLRDDLFTNQELAAMLVANPDELRNPQLQSFLYTELPQTVVDSVMAHQHQMTSRTNMEAEMAQHRQLMHAAANAMIKYELSDTSGLDLAAYRQWLRNKESIEAAYERSASYFLEGSLTLAEEKRDSIPLQFDLSTWEVAEHAYYEELTDIIIEVRLDSTHYAAYDSTTVLLIEDIADNSEGLAGRLARGLLNTFYGYDYNVIPQDINVHQMRSPKSVGNNSTRRYSSRELIAVPNPVRDQVVFHYDLPQDLQSGVLKVYDVNGKLAAELHLNAAQGQIRWLTGNQQRGLYYCVIEQAGYRTTPLKLLLID